MYTHILINIDFYFLILFPYYSYFNFNVYSTFGCFYHESIVPTSIYLSLQFFIIILVFKLLNYLTAKHTTGHFYYHSIYGLRIIFKHFNLILTKKAFPSPSHISAKIFRLIDTHHFKLATLIISSRIFRLADSLSSTKRSTNDDKNFFLFLHLLAAVQDHVP